MVAELINQFIWYDLFFYPTGFDGCRVDQSITLIFQLFRYYPADFDGCWVDQSITLIFQLFRYYPAGADGCGVNWLFFPILPNTLRMLVSFRNKHNYIQKTTFWVNKDPEKLYSLNCPFFVVTTFSWNSVHKWWLINMRHGLVFF